MRTLCHQTGFTLIELMITLAILAVVTSIAASSYTGYITEARINVAHNNVESLRLFMEDHYLTQGTYSAVSEQTIYTQSDQASELDTYYGWSPSDRQYTYTVTTTTDSWDILVEHPSGIWLRCQQRMDNCCAKGDAGALKTNCP